MKKILILCFVLIFVASCGNDTLENNGNTDINDGVNNEVILEENIELTSDEEEMINEILDF